MRWRSHWVILVRLKHLTIILKLIGTALGLAVLVYIVIVAINRNDRPPSQLAEDFASSIDSRPAIPDSANAFFFMMGFAGPPEIDPAELGLKRRNWYAEQVANGNAAPTDDPFANDFDLQPGRSEAVSALASDCQQLSANCLDLAAVRTLVATEWLDEEAWLLGRYIELIVHEEYSELIPATLLWPSPSYSRLGYGQRLLMLSALVSARNGDRSHVIALLEADLKFWRMVLASSDLLITKMIATAYVRNHFVQGNRVLSELHKSVRVDTIPSNWLVEISAAEKSMARSLIGDWRFAQNSLQTTASDLPYIPTSSSIDGATFIEKLEWRMLLPLLQPQDTSNRYAARIAKFIELFDAPYRDLPAAFEAAKTVPFDDPVPFSRAYNLAGDLHFPMNNNFGSYAVRVADLEGIRRAAVVTSRLREQGIGAASVPGQLSISAITDPYTRGPLGWSTDLNEVVFHGLQEDDRGTHRMRY